jgi:agmatine/peptidylarginine deiminase
MLRLPAEWETQEFVQLTFPHQNTDWNEYLDEAIDTFVTIAKNIAKYQKVLIVTKNLDTIKKKFPQKKNLTFIMLDSDDTWSRDFGGITIQDDSGLKILDFTFNGWGKKFDAKKDNQITQKLKLKGIFKEYATHQTIPFVLEGGAIESNGDGILLTTSQCLLEKNRNPRLTKSAIEKKLIQLFGLKKVLWLDHGYLAGDDTDSHIDTLARFVSHDTIMYQSCDDKNDEHYEELYNMYLQLKSFKQNNGKPFNLIALPWIEPKYYDDERLPATYANFLMINGAVLVPTYNDKNDEETLNIFRKVFKNKDVIGIDCSILIRQHGSLHCVTMQYPKLSNN